MADTADPHELRTLPAATAGAAAVSAGRLLRALSSPAVSREVEGALAGALAYPGARSADGGADVGAIVDKALVNLGADLARLVNGRVSTEIDGRLAGDTAGIVAKAKTLAGLYQDMGIAKERLLFAIPATWEGIAAVKQLEADGLACHVGGVFSLGQASAALDAAASVVQPAVGAVGDWYGKHPNAPGRPAAGPAPRADAGSLHHVGGGAGGAEEAGLDRAAQARAWAGHSDMGGFCGGF